MTKRHVAFSLLFRRRALALLGLFLIFVTILTQLTRLGNVSIDTKPIAPHARVRRIQQPQVLLPHPSHVVPALSLPPTRAPYVYENATIARQCYHERDFGLLDALRHSKTTYCSTGGWNATLANSVKGAKATKVTTLQAPGGLRSATFQNLVLNLVGVRIHAPIASMAQDGGKHDPRFEFNPNLIHCGCDEFAHAFKALPVKKAREQQVWHPSVLFSSTDGLPDSSICAPSFTRLNASEDLVDPTSSAFDPVETVVFDAPVVLIARRDDHNPFFQIANALNAWIMVQALEWDTTATHVIHLDGGYPSPIDELHGKLLSPHHPVIPGATLVNKRLHFRSDVLVAPYEGSGPMMQHLNNDEPCFESTLLTAFRAEALRAMGITPELEAKIARTQGRPMLVTVITRRPYNGRVLQRVWLNEDEILDRMRRQYSNVHVAFRSIDFVNLTLADQMKTTLESDMIISMHGAGLVNVLWSRPSTVILEIFPKKRFRWGYRNLCQFLGCQWHQFRGGQDVGENPHPNAKSKRIPYEEWMDVFQPLFNQSYQAYETNIRAQ